MNIVAIFDTDVIERVDRLDYWVEEVLRPIILSKTTLATMPNNVSIEIPGTKSIDFLGRMGGIVTNEFNLFEIQTSPMIARVGGGDSDLVNRFPYALVFNVSSESSPQSFLAQESRAISLPAGSAALIDFRRPFELSSGRNSTQRLYIGLTESVVHEYMPDAADLVAIATNHESGWGKMLSSYLVGLSGHNLANIGDSPATLDLVRDHIVTLLYKALCDARGNDPGWLRRDVDGRHMHLLVAVKSRLRELASDPDITAARVAETLGISTRTLHRLYLRQQGRQTFLEDLRSFRIHAAKQLLANPRSDNLTLESIGRRCGFHEQSTFIRAFRQHTGLTPGQFRRFCRNGWKPE
ncbi:helix-turn-helix domain-containing protein [Burkholderia metallica]|uniref:helix-turn-helix transcriptional regulator n=1 Tax=Burkholderia metallica TaxID=488729 RepID=UPI00157AFBE7|nr:AraC family transcriptional regulator [Burkholderia metallica]NTZ83606.1 helix-turn-helix domain-containing protein [Burkholderia metallica]